MSAKGPKTRFSLLAVAGALVLLVGGSSATAGRQGAKSKVVIKKLSAGAVKGAVKSGRGSCRGGRTVSLHRHVSFYTEKLATTTTAANGRWRFDRKLAPGRYFAKVASSRGCRYDNSKAKRLR